MKKIKYLSMILFLSLVSCKNPVTVNNLVTLHLGEGKINNLNTLVLTYDEFMNLDKYPSIEGKRFCSYYYDALLTSIYYKTDKVPTKSIDLYARYIDDNSFIYEENIDSETNEKYITITGIDPNKYIDESLTIPECIEYIPISKIATNGLSNLNIDRLELEGIEEIEIDAFNNSKISYLRISDNIQNIENGAFRNIKYLYNVDIEDNPYYSATNNLIMRKIDGKKREIIGFYNEYWNSMFTEQYLNSVEIVGIAPYSFSNIYSVEDIEAVKDEDGKPAKDEEGNIIYKNVPDGFSLYVPSTLTYISERAFENCQVYRFNKTTKEETPIQLGAYFFRRLKEVKDYAFNNSCITLLKYETKIEDNVVVPFGEGVEKFGKGAFQNTDFEKITLPKSLKVIDDDCFKGCSKLKEIFYEGTKEEFDNLIIGSGNEVLKEAKVYYFSVESVEDGWYYYDGENHNKVPSPVLHKSL